MSELRNLELKTVSNVYSSTCSTTHGRIGPVVPTGMIRWVTFLSFQSADGGEAVMSLPSKCGLYLASVVTGAKASLIATQHRKMLVYFRGSTMSGRVPPVQIPGRSNVNSPLFSIAAGKYLGVFATGSTVLINAQYFDE